MKLFMASCGLKKAMVANIEQVFTIAKIYLRLPSLRFRHIFVHIDEPQA